MARLNRTFTVVVAGSLIALHSMVLPALYIGVGMLIRENHEELFVEHARTFARVVADEFEVGAALDSQSRTADLLDLAVIHGEARFAELAVADRVVRSALNSPEIRSPRNTDLRYRMGGDDVYFVVLPIMHGEQRAELRLGFDERPTEEQILSAMHRMLWMLSLYALVTLGVAIYLGGRLSRPIRRLQDAARAIASGNYAEPLHIESPVRELTELAADLDAMRGELVGVNERLQEQIREKELAEVCQTALERQLRHRQRLETVGTLAGGIAHEFNNVLVPIMLFTDAALQDLPPGSASHADLQRVLLSARRAKDIVKKILTFSHALGDAKLTSVDLKGIVQEAFILFRALAPPSVEIRAELDADVPPVDGDATLALDLVMNLCTNALQSMQDRPGLLTLGLRSVVGQSEEPGVELRVSDTGHGMDGATLERMFEPFFTTRPVGEGTGLGLAVVHGIVKSFKARIAVESTPGAGTTIRVQFPLQGTVQTLSPVAGTST